MLKNDLKRGKSGSRSTNAALAIPSYTVATAPSAAAHTGRLIYVSDGAAGAACLAYSDGTNWLRVVLGAAIAAS